MARTFVNLPRALMRATRIDWQIDTRGQSASETTSDIPQVVYSALPRWIGTPQVRLRRAHLLHWRATIAELGGRQNIARVPMVDPLGAPLSEWNATALRDGLTYDGGQAFAEGTGFAYEPFATVVDAAAQGATEIVLDVAPTGQAIRQGQIMSHDDWPFMVTGILDVSGTEYTVSIRTPLRAAIEAGAEVLMEGVGRFQMVGDLVGNPVYTATQQTSVEIGFVEVLNR